jgi:hypothetical protein
MTDEVQEKPNNNPNYKSRRVLQEENDQLKAGLDALMARMAALESAPRGTVTVDGLVDALKADRESANSARLQRELDETRAQLEDLKRPQTPTSGVPYSGWVQAKEDCWFPLGGYRKGPKEGQPGEIFQVDMPDYWPGCPFTPIIVKGQDADGRYITAPHPDFQSH